MSINAFFFIIAGILVKTDWDTHQLPNKWTGLLLFSGLGIAWHDHHLLWSLKGLLLGAGILGVIRYIGYKFYTQECLGLGDLKLNAAIGAWWGPALVVNSTYIGFIVGGIVGLGWILFFSKDRLTPIPFGPCLIAGSILAQDPPLSWTIHLPASWFLLC